MSWVADALVPALKKDLLNMLEPVLMSSLNKFVAGYMPFPRAAAGETPSPARGLMVAGGGGSDRASAEPELRSA